MRRRLLLAVALASVVAAGTLAYLLASSPSTPAPVSAAQATAAAADSCRQLAAFDELVRANAPLDQVNAALKRATDRARTAARGDARWQALAGGTQSLRIALDANDARAARVGIDVVRAECRRSSARP